MTDKQTDPRDRIAEALYAHDHPGHLVPLNETGMGPAYRESADAVLAVLPPTADRAAVEQQLGEQLDEAGATIAQQTAALAQADERVEFYEAAHARMRDRLEVTRVRVQRLHAPGANGECQHCHNSSPCPTVQALDGPDDELRRLAAEAQQPDTETPRCPAREPLDGAQCSKQDGHDGAHSDRPGRIWYPVPTEEECCGAEPPTRADDPNGVWGDCWCTLPPGHDGEHSCQPCADRHGAPGWTDAPAAPVQPAADDTDPDPWHDDPKANTQEADLDRPQEVVHGCPPDGSGLTPCCGRTPFELPLSDRVSSEAPVTCKGPRP